MMRLSDQQVKASSRLKGSTLVIAVPGSGKTTILLERIKNLIESGVDPRKILTISFSRAAARELKERFSKSFSSQVDPDFQTIHAFSFMVLRDYGKKNFINYKLLEGNPKISKYQVIIDFYRKYNKAYLTDETMEELILDIGYAKNMMIGPEDVGSKILFFEQIFADYEAFKVKHKYIDFDDMLTLAYQVLKEDGDLKKAYVDAYDYVQVDEGQDTSKVQMEIIKLLTKDKNNLFIVADDDQSIYSFRGADPQGLFDLLDFYDDLELIHMDHNFRSSKNIVIASSGLIKANKKRFEKDLTATRDYQAPVDVVKVDRPGDQYSYITDQIEDKNLQDVAILYRNNVSAMGLIEYLERLNIDFKLRDNSSLSFGGSRVAKDLIGILEFASRRDDLGLLEEIFFKLDAYISRKQINYLKTKHQAGDLLEAIKEIPSNPAYTKETINRLISRFDSLESLHFHQKLDFIGSEIGYRDYLTRSSKTLGQGLWSQLLVYESLLAVSQNTMDLEDFKARLSYLDDLVKRRKKARSGLNLSTIHSAKGMEFKNVYMIDCYDGIFPAKLDRDDPGNLEEERRLFYVGMTRAMDRLTIIFPSYLAGQDLDMSVFIGELADL